MAGAQPRRVLVRSACGSATSAYVGARELFRLHPAAPRCKSGRRGPPARQGPNARRLAARLHQVLQGILRKPQGNPDCPPFGGQLPLLAAAPSETLGRSGDRVHGAVIPGQDTHASLCSREINSPPRAVPGANQIGPRGTGQSHRRDLWGQVPARTPGVSAYPRAVAGDHLGRSRRPHNHMACMQSKASIHKANRVRLPDRHRFKRRTTVGAEDRADSD